MCAAFTVRRRRSSSDLHKQTLELRGGVKLTRGQGWIQAEKVTIDLATAHVTASQIKVSIPVPKP